MNKAIEYRELIVLSGHGSTVHGTYHKVRNGTSTAKLNFAQPKPVGILFLNSLFLPRTATGDSAVFWAECFAQCGYPTFRIDLPGLGDSDAPFNTSLLDYINAGGYEEIASKKIEELVNQFDLAGIVVVGHCAGAVSAIFAGAASKDCKGLILMDPYFFLPQQMKKSKAWKRLVRWGAESRIGGLLSSLYDRLKKARLLLRGSQPPGNANFPLLQRWKEAAGTRGLPVLYFKAPGRKAAGTKPRTGEFDYLQHLLTLAGRRAKVTVQLVEDTDHSFANSAGREAVRQSTELWLGTHFPCARHEHTTECALQAVSSETTLAAEDQAACM